MPMQWQQQQPGLLLLMKKAENSLEPDSRKPREQRNEALIPLEEQLQRDMVRLGKSCHPDTGRLPIPQEKDTRKLRDITKPLKWSRPGRSFLTVF